MLTRHTVLSGLLAFLVSGSLAWAQETINRTVPITRPNIASYTPGSLYIVVNPNPYIRVTIVDADGLHQEFEYPCATPCANDTPARVTTLISALNTANLTTRSLWRRIFDRLVLDFPGRFQGGATVP